MAFSVAEMVARAAGAAPTGNGTSAPPQAGVLEGANPTQYTPSNPITLFIIQVRRILHNPLAVIPLFTVSWSPLTPRPG